MHLQKALEAIDSLTSKVESLNEKTISLEDKLLKQNAAHQGEVDKINKLHKAKSNLLIKKINEIDQTNSTLLDKQKALKKEIQENNRKKKKRWNEARNRITEQQKQRSG